MINRLYDMPLRFGYWLLLPFICVYYIFTEKKQCKTSFLVGWCGLQIQVYPDNLVGDISDRDKLLILEYMRRHPE